MAEQWQVTNAVVARLQSAIIKHPDEVWIATINGEQFRCRSGRSTFKTIGAAKCAVRSHIGSRIEVLVSKKIGMRPVYEWEYRDKLYIAMDELISSGRLEFVQQGA